MLSSYCTNNSTGNWSVVDLTENESKLSVSERLLLIECSKNFRTFFTMLTSIEGSKINTLTNIQNSLIDLFENKVKVIAECKRQSGVSTICQIYAVWEALLHKQKVRVKTPNLHTMELFFDKATTFLKQLPNWMLEVNAYDIASKNKIVFTNGGSIEPISAGCSIDMLIVDDLQLKTITEDFIGLDNIELTKLLAAAVNCLHNTDNLILFRRFSSRA